MSQITLAKQYCFTTANDELFPYINSNGKFIGTNEFSQISFWDNKKEAEEFLHHYPDLDLRLMEVTITMSSIT